jgi:predicted 3-demethylubiquinone-9 3-methyltransferase (glyoxalase superfamily)
MANLSPGPKVSLMLWYEGAAEQAAAHYVKAFKDGAITAVTRYPQDGMAPEGSVMTVSFTLGGAHFTGLNAGPMFKPTEATSIVVLCDDQAEVDFLWQHMAEGGAHSRCGWLKDRWGFSWQITPRRLIEITTNGSPAQKERAFAAMMQMDKLIIADLETAIAG